MLIMLSRFSALLISVILIVACQGPEELTRPSIYEGPSFGEKFFTLTCQRVAYTSSLAKREKDPNALVDVSGERYRKACRYGPEFFNAEYAELNDPKLYALFNRRDDFIESMNLIFPDNELSELQDYMVKIVDLTDTGEFPALVDRTSFALEKIVDEPTSHFALARIERRSFYRPRPVALGLLQEALHYPELRTLFNDVLRVVASDESGKPALLALGNGLSFELSTARAVDDAELDDPMHPADPDRLLNWVTDFLFETDVRFGGSKARYLVRRDWRGVPIVNLVNGIIPSPFVDSNSDGMADVDFMGEFILQSSAIAPTPFHYDATKEDPANGRDSDGRALDTQGNLVFEYLDLDKTLFAGLMRDALLIMDPAENALLKFIAAFKNVMGDRKNEVLVDRFAKRSIEFNGFDIANSPLVDFIYGVTSLVYDPALVETLSASKKLVNENPDSVAKAIQSIRNAFDSAENFPERNLKEGSILFDQILLHARKLGRTSGLVKDLLAALKDPRTKNLDQMFVNYFSYADVHILGSGDKVISESGGTTLFTRLVDRSQSDSGSNRSIQSRLFNIIADTNGMRICNKEGAKITVPGICSIPIVSSSDLCSRTYRECELFEIENVALFYLQSIARARNAQGVLQPHGKAEFRLKTENMDTVTALAVKTVGTDLILETLTGIDGMGQYPTTEALNRFMFLEELPSMLITVQDLPRDIDGELVYTAHRGSLYSWEIPHPGMSCAADDPCVFYDAFRPIAQAFADHDQEKLLLDILTVLHRHWSSETCTDNQYSDPNAENFAYGSNSVSYEPLIIWLLKESDLYPSLRQLASVVSDTINDGIPFAESLGKTLDFVLNPVIGLTTRQGADEIYYSDKQTKVEGGVPPIYLLVDSYNAMDEALDQGDEKTRTGWDEATEHLLNVFFTHDDENGGFKNKRVIPTLSLAIDLLIERIRRRSPDCSVSTECLHGGICQVNGRCSTRHHADLTFGWFSNEMRGDIERAFNSPVVAASVDLISELHKDPAAEASLNRLLYYLVDEVEDEEVFASTLTALADIVQSLLADSDIVPLLHVLSDILVKEEGFIDKAVSFLKPAVERDDKGALVRILKNSVIEQSPGESPLGTLYEIAKEMHRENPGETGPYMVEDYRRAFYEMADFVGNQKTGLVNFFTLIKNRCGGPCSK